MSPEDFRRPCREAGGGSDYPGMTQVTAQMSVSLDGFYTGPVDDRDPKDMTGWMHGPEAPGFFRVTRWVIDAMGWRERLGFAGGERSINSEIIEETFAAAGAYVMGRRMFDAGEVPWGDNPPFRAPVFVVTHRPREVLRARGRHVVHVRDRRRRGGRRAGPGGRGGGRQGRGRGRRRHAAAPGAAARAARPARAAHRPGAARRRPAPVRRQPRPGRRRGDRAHPDAGGRDPEVTHIRYTRGRPHPAGARRRPRHRRRRCRRAVRRVPR